MRSPLSVLLYSSPSSIVYTNAGITVWLSALFLVKEENARGDLNEGETVKVRSAPYLIFLPSFYH